MTHYTHARSSRKAIRRRSKQVNNFTGKKRFEIEPLELRTLLTTLAPLINTTSLVAEVSSLIPSGTSRLQFTAASPVLVRAYIDFNGDEVFAESERVSTAAGFVANAGIGQLIFDVPASSVARQVSAKIQWSPLSAGSSLGLSDSASGQVSIQAAPSGRLGREVFVSALYDRMPGETVDGGTFGVDRFASVQQAIQVTAANGVVSLVAGSFSQPITLGKNITLRGLSTNAADTVISPTSPTAHGITIANAADVVIENLTISGANDGIRSTSAGAVTITNVVSTSNVNHGLNIRNAQGVTISNSEFRSNDADLNGEGRGVQLINVGHVALNRVTADGNKLGLAVAKALSVTDDSGTYSNNTDHGLLLSDIAGNVTLTRTILQNNDRNVDGKGDGLVIEKGTATRAVAGSLGLYGVTIGTTANGNQRDGISVQSVGGDVVFGDQTRVSGNNSDGVTLGTVDGAVRISNSTFDANKGLDQQGTNFFLLRATDFVVTDSVFSNTGFKDGLQIETVTGGVDISGSNFNGNNRYGIRIDRSNSVRLDNNSVQNNGAEGIRLSNNSGGVRITNVNAGSNKRDGLRLTGAGDTTIDGGEFSGIFVRQANSITVNANPVTGSTWVASTDRVSVEALNAVTLNTNLEAGSSSVQVIANSDGRGDEGFVMAAGTSLITSNETSGAVSITVNSMLGGTGVANLQQIVAGAAQGTVGIYTNGGPIVNGLAVGDNITGSRTVLHAMGSVGAAENALTGKVSRIEGAGNGFYFLNSRPLTIGGVDPRFAGVASPAQAIDVRSLGALTVEENVSGAEGVFLKAVETSGFGDDLTVNSGVTVQSKQSNVDLCAGDNVTLTNRSTISAGGSILIKSDCEDNDPGQGTTITIASHLFSSNGIRVEAGNDGDVYDIMYPVNSRFTGGLTIVEPSSVGGGIDSVIITGTELDDTLFVTPAADNVIVARDAANAETIFVPSRVEKLRVSTLAGRDTVTVAAPSTMLLLLDGGSPNFGDAGVPVGDTLKFDPRGKVFTMADSKFRINGLPDLAFQNFEAIELANASPGAAQRFDFNSTLSTPTGIGSTPTQNGYRSVAPQTKYTKGGFGWDVPIDTTYTSDNSGQLSNLLNDTHVFTPSSGADTRTFTATVANGLVLVTVNYGSNSNTVSAFQIENADTNETLVTSTGSYTGNWGHSSFFVEVTDGTLDLRFRAPFGPRRLIAINGLSIDPATLLGMGIAPPSNALPADGTTIDKFVFSGPANTLVTLSSTLGSIKGVDADPFILGTQILTDQQGQAVVQVQRSAVQGTASFTFSLPTGKLLSSAQLDYAIVNARNFDFNTPSSATFSPFDSINNPDGYIGVAHNSLFSASTGFGWTGSSINVFALSPSIGGSRAALYDDGHISSDARTFRTLLSNGTYQVSVLSGSDIDHQSYSIAANGRVVVDNQKIARRNLLESVFTVTVSSGQLDLTFSQKAGTFENPNWVVNAISIRPTTLVKPITPVANIGAVAGNGTSLSRLTFNTSALNGTFVTVATTAGTITTADADPHTAGVQVAVANGQIQFDLRASNKPGVPIIELHTQKGDHRATIDDRAFLEFVDAFFAGSGGQTPLF